LRIGATHRYISAMARVIWFCVFFCLTMTGSCYTLSIVRFVNGTTETIKLKSCHTGQEIQIEPGSLYNLPHAAGDLVVTTLAQGELRFVAVEPPAMDRIDRGYVDKRSSILGPGSVTVTIRFEPDGKLYALLPGRQTVDKGTTQPAEYPKQAQKPPRGEREQQSKGAANDHPVTASLSRAR
jgi:hypothetical protein